MLEKIVRRVSNIPSGGDDLIDLPGLIDLIEIELDLSTGNTSVRNRLLHVADSLRPSPDDHTISARAAILEAADRLKHIEDFLIASGFETAKDASGG